jgi:hypothetical protein
MVEIRPSLFLSPSLSKVEQNLLYLVSNWYPRQRTNGKAAPRNPASLQELDITELDWAEARVSARSRAGEGSLNKYGLHASGIEFFGLSGSLSSP